MFVHKSVFACRKPLHTEHLMYNRNSCDIREKSMTGSFNSASPQSASEQAQVLYGTGTFLVRLWTLEPGAVLTGYPQTPIHRSQTFLISGQLEAVAQDKPTQLPSGQRVEFFAQSPHQLENTGTQPAVWLEVAQGDQLPVMPLPEVTETRPWGSFTVLKDEPDYKLKQLMNTPGNRLSLQRHQQREEHWLVIQGHPEITLDDAQIPLSPGEYIKIPLHSWHRLANPAAPESGEMVEIIELQLGAYFGEDDIERREDDYGRT